MSSKASYKGFGISELLIVFIFLSLVGFAALTVLNNNRITVSEESPECNDSLFTSLAKSDNLTPVQHCWVEHHDVDGERYRLIGISYGEGMDCPSGCIYDHKTYLLDSDDKRVNVLDTFYQPPDLSLGSSEKACRYVFSYNLRVLLVANPDQISRQLVVEEGTLKWKLSLNQFSGRSSNSEGLYRDDDSKCLRTGSVITDLEGNLERVSDQPSFMIE